MSNETWTPNASICSLETITASATSTQLYYVYFSSYVKLYLTKILQYKHHYIIRYLVTYVAQKLSGWHGLDSYLQYELFGIGPGVLDTTRLIVAQVLIV